MFWYLHQQNHLFPQEDRDSFLNQALTYLNPSLAFAEIVERSPSDKVGKVAYLLGNAGNYLIAILIYKSLKKEKEMSYYLDRFNKIANKCVPLDYLSKGSDELLVGRSGYVCGALHLNRIFKRQIIPKSTIQKLCVSTMQSGQLITARFKYS